MAASRDWVAAGHSAHHDKVSQRRKRGAEEEFETQSKISTHFKKLRINNAPLPSRPEPVGGVSLCPHSHNTDPRAPTCQNHRDSPPSIRSASAADDFMPVDDTPHRIVIHDLDAELAQIEADEEQSRAFLMPDVDKKVTAIPQRLLQSRTAQTENRTTALVLYQEPTSITVPEEEDAVRRAVMAARARVRERQTQKHREEAMMKNTDPKLHGQGEAELDDSMSDAISQRGEDDADAMEIE